MKDASIDEHCRTYGLAQSCAVLDVSISGYHAWKRGGTPDRRRLTDAQVLAPGLIHPADRGSQYAGHAFRARLEECGMIASMSRKVNCWDTQSRIVFEHQPDLARAGIGYVAFALIYRSGFGVPRALPGPAYVT